MDKTATIFDIQRFSTNDGGGIRTIVFFKGCPLNCLWCSNPESKTITSQILYWKNRCIGCGRCVEVCPVRKGCKNAGQGECTLCMRCADACPAKALRQSGMEMTLDDIMKKVSRDAFAYRYSGGGVTLSGGEPLLQWEFAACLAAELKSRLYDVAIETTGCAKWENAWEVFKNCDRILYDVKFMDPQMHMDLTGAGNALILENAQKLARTGKEVIYRIPLMEGYNADDNNIKKLIAFAKQNRAAGIHLLPYHEYGKPKYEALGMLYSFHAAAPAEARIEEIKTLIIKNGLDVSVGG